MEEVGEAFQDWEEVSRGSSDSDLVDSPKSVDRDSRSFEEIQAHSEGLIRLDYFSLDTDNGNGGLGVGGYPKSEEGSGVESDNPSWVDPGTEATHFLGRVSGEYWSDSGSERSEDRKVGNFEAKGEVGIEAAVGIEGEGGKVGAFEGGFSEFGGKSQVALEESLERQVGLERFEGVRGKVDDSVKFWSDSGGDGLLVGDARSAGEDLGEREGGNLAGEENLAVVAAAGEKAKPGGEGKEVVWWKLPIEMIKYCVFRVSPVWSFSMAAAVLGFVILGRRLYKMKRRTQSLQLKVAVDDKKVSQVMSRAAKLNEAFSVVRRVPIVRPLLPTAGVNSWPVMTLR